VERGGRNRKPSSALQQEISRLLEDRRQKDAAPVDRGYAHRPMDDQRERAHTREIEQTDVAVKCRRCFPH
jgi:hypothetical protein